MTPIEEKWFSELSDKRRRIATTVDGDFAVGNIWDTLKDIFSEKAHFVYELLQNANDCEAKKVKFYLKEDGLYFSHNGIKHFSVSNPNTEHLDLENGKLGDINAITSIARSNKIDESTIGKFGIGFKSIYQYSNNPHIYDVNFKFKIEQFIVPVLLDVDLAYREKEETTFYFPFDRKEPDAKKSYDEILKKLKNLNYPLIFLSNLNEIHWKTDGEHGKYSVIEKSDSTYSGNIHNQELEVINEINSEVFSEDLILFSRELNHNEHKLFYSIGFYKNKQNKISPKKLPAFCFFPTDHETKLNFIIHAPFLLIKNREKIEEDKEHNERLIELLSILSTEALLILRDKKLITDDFIYKILPYREIEGLFAPFYHKIKTLFQRENVLPTNSNNYVAKHEAYWGQDGTVLKQFSDVQLSQLLEVNSAYWVLRSFPVSKCVNNNELRNYIDSCVSGHYSIKDLIKKIDSEFIEKQSIEWLYNFYLFLHDNNPYWEELKHEAIFIDSLSRAVPVSDYREGILYIPTKKNSPFQTLNLDLFEYSSKKLEEKQESQSNVKKGGKPTKKYKKNGRTLAIEFYSKFGIQERTLYDEFREALTTFQFYNYNKKCSPEDLFKIAFRYFKECPIQDRKSVIKEIKGLSFIPYLDHKLTLNFSTGDSLFYPKEEILNFYNGNPSIRYVDTESLNLWIKNRELLDLFLKDLGVRFELPDLKEEVFSIILPQYKKHGKAVNNTLKEAVNDFKTVFEYYKKANSEEVEELYLEINGVRFLISNKLSAPSSSLWSSSKVTYYPSNILLKYFETKPDTLFIDLKLYKENIDEKHIQKFEEFLKFLKINYSPVIKSLEIARHDTEYKVIKDIDGNALKSSSSGHNDQGTFDNVIDGSAEILKYIIEKKDFNKSKLLWHIIAEVNENENDLCSKLWGNHKFFYYSQQHQKFESPALLNLKNQKWLVDKTGEFKAPFELSLNDLANGYSLEFKKIRKIDDLLGFMPAVYISKNDKIAEIFEEFSVEEAREAKELLKAHKAKKDIHQKSLILGNKPETRFNDLQSLNGILSISQQNKSKKSKSITEKSIDEDDLFSKGIEEIEKQIELKKSQNKLISDVKTKTKYSYEWFLSFLKLLKSFGDSQSNSKQKSIYFYGIHQFTNDNKYFLLTGASSYISSEIENASDLKLILHSGDGTQEQIVIEGASKKGQDILVFIREGLNEKMLSRLSNILRVEICFTPSINLVERLYVKFKNQEFIEKWDSINDSLPPLKFIYGPPGTGKTTEICKSVLQFIELKSDSKVLILTPTNKAADVIAKKLLSDDEYIALKRLSSATDPELENRNVYCDGIKDEDFEYMNVLVSTIHRLPYFEIENAGYLFQQKWDYVIFDESSMIGIHYITFALMAIRKVNDNANFIVAGDPKQIPPVLDIDDKEFENFDFQDENVYEMLDLKSFNPKNQNIRKKDEINNLVKQYRSLPSIGSVFSDLSYSGLLKHNREDSCPETKVFPEKITKLFKSNVSFVDIPLDENNSLFKVSKLFYSSYHVYCALLITEFISYFDKQNMEDDWTIGIVSPYKAQAVLMNRLIATQNLSDKIKVYSDTVHGFQGDECDIVFFVCNPNNYRYTGNEKSLLSKEYIYNVAISRAKDYLIILHPFSKIPDNDFISKIVKSYLNNTENQNIISASELEKLIFNDDRFIEKNSFVSGHDNVNVFGSSVMKYIIKSNDNAIDIQLNN
jgi:hypothetical protein